MVSFWFLMFFFNKSCQRRILPKYYFTILDYRKLPDSLNFLAEYLITFHVRPSPIFLCFSCTIFTCPSRAHNHGNWCENIPFELVLTSVLQIPCNQDTSYYCRERCSITKKGLQLSCTLKHFNLHILHTHCFSQIHFNIFL
jgi:hypothetical protein